jgi:hypothetical protein
MTGIAGHDAGMCGHDETEYATINELRVISPIKPVVPLTPAKARIDSLKRTKDAAAKNLKAERDRQKVAKAQQAIATVNSSFP